MRRDESWVRFLVVTNREFEADGTLYFHGIDNAVGIRGEDEAEVKLYVSPDLQIWKAPGQEGSNSTIDHSYLVTNARAMNRRAGKRK